MRQIFLFLNSFFLTDPEDNSLILSRSGNSETKLLPQVLIFFTYGILVILTLSGFFYRGDDLFVKVYDDALMFYRYAFYISQDHAYAWNPDGMPVYGTTSIVYTFVTLFFYELLPDLLPHYLMGMISRFSGVLIYMLAGVLLFLTRSRPASQMILLLYLLTFSFFNLFLSHVYSGMETLTAAFFMFAFIFSLQQFKATGQKVYFYTGLIPVLIMFALRPDAAVYTTLIPMVYFLVERKPGYLFYVLFSIAGAGAVLAFSSSYFGHPFPLPFYVKREIFDIDMEEENLLYISEFLFSPPILISLILMGMATVVQTKERVLFVSILLSILIHSVYLTFFTNQNMGMNARFYMPAFPIVFYGGFVAATLLWEKYSGRLPFNFRGKPVTEVFLILVSVFLLVVLSGELKKVNKNRTGYTSYPEYYNAIVKIYPVKRKDGSVGETSMLAELMQMPAGCSVTASEMGITGVNFLHSRVIDMLGLNYPEYVFSKDRNIVRLLTEVEKPDLIFEANNFEEINRGLRASSFVKKNYGFIKRSDAGMPLGFWYKKNSPCSPFFDELLQKTGLL